MEHISWKTIASTWVNSSITARWPNRIMSCFSYKWETISPEKQGGTPSSVKHSILDLMPTHRLCTSDLLGDRWFWSWWLTQHYGTRISDQCSFMWGLNTQDSPLHYQLPTSYTRIIAAVFKSGTPPNKVFAGICPDRHAWVIGPQIFTWNVMWGGMNNDASFTAHIHNILQKTE